MEAAGGSPPVGTMAFRLRHRSRGKKQAFEGGDRRAGEPTQRGAFRLEPHQVRLAQDRQARERLPVPHAARIDACEVAAPAGGLHGARDKAGEPAEEVPLPRFGIHDLPGGEIDVGNHRLFQCRHAVAVRPVVRVRRTGWAVVVRGWVAGVGRGTSATTVAGGAVDHGTVIEWRWRAVRARSLARAISRSPGCTGLRKAMLQVWATDCSAPAVAGDGKSRVGQGEQHTAMAGAKGVERHRGHRHRQLGRARTGGDELEAEGTGRPVARQHEPRPAPRLGGRVLRAIGGRVHPGPPIGLLQNRDRKWNATGLRLHSGARGRVDVDLASRRPRKRFEEGRIVPGENAAPHLPCRAFGDEAADAGAPPGGRIFRPQGRAGVHRGEQLRHAAVLAGDGLQHRDVRLTLPPQAQHGLELPDRAGRKRQVSLVHHQDAGDLQYAGFDGLHVIAEAGRVHNDAHRRHVHDLHLRLAGAHGLDHDGVAARGVEHVHYMMDAPREPPEMSARGDGADEDARIVRVAAHANAIAKHRPARKGARGVHRHHPHRTAALAQLGRRRRPPASTCRRRGGR